MLDEIELQQGVWHFFAMENGLLDLNASAE